MSLFHHKSLIGRIFLWVGACIHIDYTPHHCMQMPLSVSLFQGRFTNSKGHKSKQLWARHIFRVMPLWSVTNRVRNRDRLHPKLDQIWIIGPSHWWPSASWLKSRRAGREVAILRQTPQISDKWENGCL